MPSFSPGPVVRYFSTEVKRNQQFYMYRVNGAHFSAEQHLDLLKSADPAVRDKQSPSGKEGVFSHWRLGRILGKFYGAGSFPVLQQSTIRRYWFSASKENEMHTWFLSWSERERIPSGSVPTTVQWSSKWEPGEGTVWLSIFRRLLSNRTSARLGPNASHGEEKGTK